MQEEPRKIEYRANKQPMKYGAIRCIFSGNLTRDKLRFIVSQIDIVPAVARTRIDSEIYTHIAGESCQRFGGIGPVCQATIRLHDDNKTVFAARPLAAFFIFFKYLPDLLACQMHTKLLRPCCIFVYILFHFKFFYISAPLYIFGLFFLSRTHTYCFCWSRHCQWQ